MRVSKAQYPRWTKTLGDTISSSLASRSNTMVWTMSVRFEVPLVPIDLSIRSSVCSRSYKSKEQCVECMSFRRTKNHYLYKRARLSVTLQLLRENGLGQHQKRSGFRISLTKKTVAGEACPSLLSRDSDHFPLISPSLFSLDASLAIKKRRC